MRRLVFFVLFLSFLCRACAAPSGTMSPSPTALIHTPAGSSSPAPKSTPTQESTPEIDSLTYDDLPGGVPYSNSQGYANMSLILPHGWQGALVESDDAGRFGIDFWPEESPENKLELRYLPERIGLCGTGLISEQTSCGELSATKLQYADLSAWTLWIFHDTPGEYTMETNASNNWVNSHTEELDKIISSFVLGEGVIHPEEAERIARSALTDYYEFCRISFDCMTGVFTVHFWNTGSYEESVEVDSSGVLLQD